MYPIAFGLPATVPGLRQDGCCHGPSTLPKYGWRALYYSTLSDVHTLGGALANFFFRLWNHVSRPNGTPQQVPNPCRIWPEIHEKWGPKSPKSLKIELWGPLGGSWGRPWSQNGRTRGSMSFFGPLLASFWSPNGSPKSSKIVSRGVPKCIVEKVSKIDPKRAPF